MLCWPHNNGFEFSKDLHHLSSCTDFIPPLYICSYAYLFYFLLDSLDTLLFKLLAMGSWSIFTLSRFLCDLVAISENFPRQEAEEKGTAQAANSKHGRDNRGNDIDVLTSETVTTNEPRQAEEGLGSTYL